MLSLWIRLINPFGSQDTRLHITMNRKGSTGQTSRLYTHVTYESLCRTVGTNQISGSSFLQWIQTSCLRNKSLLIGFPFNDKLQSFFKINFSYTHRQHFKNVVDVHIVFAVVVAGNKGRGHGTFIAV